jgi:hypothetical protein
VTIATLTRQPVYLLLLLASIGAVRWRCVQEPEKRSLSSPRLGLLLFASTSLANWAGGACWDNRTLCIASLDSTAGGSLDAGGPAYGALNGLALATSARGVQPSSSGCGCAGAAAADPDVPTTQSQWCFLLR